VIKIIGSFLLAILLTMGIFFCPYIVDIVLITFLIGSFVLVIWIVWSAINGTLL